MEYKIARYDQSFSTLYIRSIKKAERGLFDCLVFYGVSHLNMPTLFEFDGTELSQCDLPRNDPMSDERKFIFGCHPDAYIQCVQVKRGLARDFPEAKQTEIVEWLDFMPMKFK